VGLLTGAATWALGLGGLSFPAAIVGLVLALVIIFKQVTNPGVGTAGVTGVMLALYCSGRIRVTPQFTKMVVGATVGFSS
jgi:uncharacterized YccA/Bax inhibitor family protein